MDIDKRNMQPKVSVIIPTVKGDRWIDECIHSINVSTYRNIELIVVNEGKERSEQRNIGLSRATGKYIFIPDSDWEVTPGLIKECVKLMQYYNAVYIPEIIVTPGIFAKIRNWERQFYTATPIDVVRFVKRECCPYFNEKMSGPEDSDWDRRVVGNRTTSINPYYHHDGVNVWTYFKKKAYYSKTMAQFKSKNSGDKTLDWRWRCFKVFFEQGKWKRFLSNPFFALCVMGIIFVRGIIYLRCK